jgi:hypothetical protein
VKFEPVSIIGRVSTGLAQASCANAATLKQVGFTAGQLNVYYLPHADGYRGETCQLSPNCPVQPPNQNPVANMILVNTDSHDDETLAHEIGHTFSLCHIRDPTWPKPPVISYTNLMRSAFGSRDRITTGQLFRANLNAGSSLNVNGHRAGPTRACADSSSSARCPPLKLDVWPK